MTAQVDFYFDYLSPYSYLSWPRIQQICNDYTATLVLHPVLFAGLLNHWGQKGPGEIAPKREWVFKDASRYAKIHDIPFACPKYHPFNPLTALRLSLLDVAGVEQTRVVDAIFQAGWAQGIDLGSPEELARALDAAGMDGTALLAKTLDPAVKAALRTATDNAAARGIFGVPTFVVGDELFWGNDRLDHVLLALQGRDPLDQDEIQRILRRPKSADRLKSRA